MMYPPAPSAVRKPWLFGLRDPTREPPVQATPDRSLVAAAAGAATAVVVVVVGGGGLLILSSMISSMVMLYNYKIMD